MEYQAWGQRSARSPGWGGKPESLCYFTEPRDSSVVFNMVLQSTEMEAELGQGGVKPGYSGPG